MENEKKQNEIPAFSSPHFDYYFGMTLRDYFANSAMQTILKHQLERGLHLTEKAFDETVSNISYMVADSMLKQREP